MKPEKIWLGPFCKHMTPSHRKHWGFWQDSPCYDDCPKCKEPPVEFIPATSFKELADYVRELMNAEIREDDRLAASGKDPNSGDRRACLRAIRRCKDILTVTECYLNESQKETAPTLDR